MGTLGIKELVLFGEVIFGAEAKSGGPSSVSGVDVRVIEFIAEYDPSLGEALTLGEGI